jgi:hypothetical protein
MNKPRRECGSCRFWTRFSRDGRGLCDVFDCAGKADEGRGCKEWKGKKYSRIKNKEDKAFIIKEQDEQDIK